MTIVSTYQRRLANGAQSVDERGADDTLQSHALTVYLRPVQRTAAVICC